MSVSNGWSFFIYNCDTKTGFHLTFPSNLGSILDWASQFGFNFSTLDSVNKLKQNQHCTFSYSTCPALVKGVECCIPGVAVTYRHSSIAIWGRIITVGCRNTRSKYIAGWKQIITQAFIYLLHTMLWKCCRLWTDTIHTYMIYIS